MLGLLALATMANGLLKSTVERSAGETITGACALAMPSETKKPSKENSTFFFIRDRWLSEEMEFRQWVKELLHLITKLEDGKHGVLIYSSVKFVPR